MLLVVSDCAGIFGGYLLVSGKVVGIGGTGLPTGTGATTGLGSDIKSS